MTMKRKSADGPLSDRPLSDGRPSEGAAADDVTTHGLANDGSPSDGPPTEGATAAGAAADRATAEQATARSLIEAGRELFAERGYDGASVRAITARAGANLGAITYHFGSKRALYDRVVESGVEPLVPRVEAAATGSGTPLDRVGAVVREYFEHMRAHPELPYLMIQELVVGRTPPAAAIGPMMRMMQVISDLIREGQADGTIRRGEPLLLGLGIISQAVHFNLMRVPLRKLMRVDMDDPATWESIVANAVAFARGGLMETGS